MDYQGLAPVDLYVAADPDAVAIALGKAVEDLAAPKAGAAASQRVRPDPSGPLSVEHLAFALREAVATRNVSLLTFRCPGTARGGHFGTRWISLAATAAGASAAVRASRWAPHSRSRAATACRFRFVAMAIS